jgi:hypothetical protein
LKITILSSAKVELRGTPATYNHYFNDNLDKWSVLATELSKQCIIKVDRNACNDISRRRPLEKWTKGNLSA